MLHFPAVPKGVELVQPLADVLLLVPYDLLDQVVPSEQLLTLNSEKILSINSNLSWLAELPYFHWNIGR